MTAEEQTKEARVSLKRAFAISVSSAFWALLGGLTAFFAVAFAVTPGAGEEPIVDQGFFLVCVNLVPLAMVIAGASLVALLFQDPGKAMAVATVVLISVVAGGLAYLFWRYADLSSRYDQIYAFGAFVPGVVAILINWIGINHRLKGPINLGKLGNPA
ncbi:hypothetical protein [Agrobacterium sp. NPDC090283]|uniref:hypothetical protein n=1 Tax=Agrobacterium sp. NPDC090283 TaxID=3363920 RepID=UPI00383B1953